MQDITVLLGPTSNHVHSDFISFFWGFYNASSSLCIFSAFAHDFQQSWTFPLPRIRDQTVFRVCVQCDMCNVKRSLCRMHCSLYTVQGSMLIMYCAMFTVYFAMLTVQLGKHMLIFYFLFVNCDNLKISWSEFERGRIKCVIYSVQCVVCSV